MAGISVSKICVPFGGGGISWGSYWATRLPYFALPATGVSLMVGQEVTIYGDSLINVPIGSDLTVTYTCDIGAASGNDYTITPIVGNIGNHNLRIVCVSNGTTRVDETIVLSVYEKSSTDIKILMIGDSLVLSGCEEMATAVDAGLGVTGTYLGTIGTTVLHEGHSGSGWWDFINTSNFTVAGVLNVPAYFTDNSIDTPDVVLIRLGVNDVFQSCDGTIPAGLSLTDLIEYAKDFIDSFLAFDANLKILIGLPTLCSNEASKWNTAVDESIYNQDLFIQLMSEFREMLSDEFANGAYNARVDCSYESIFLDRANYGDHLHPTAAGYTQLGEGLANAINDIYARPFVTTWNTENAGSATKTIVIPTTGAGYDCYIDWGDGEAETHSTGTPGNITKVYADTGTYTVRIRGKFPRIYFNNGGDKLKLLTVANWGSIKWSSMEGAFYGCTNLTGTYSDIPDLSAVTNMYNGFRDCAAFNSSVANWNVASVTTMYSLFAGCAAFNQPLTGWSTLSCQNMQAMFYGATVFNQPLSHLFMHWVITTSSMLQDCAAFNQNLAAWDLTSMANMNFIFFGSTPISTANYDAMLIGWAAQTVLASVPLHAGGAKYSAGAAATARGVLTSAPNSWAITDGGQV